MKSSIEIRAKFDFKGETYTPSMMLDLEQQMARYGELPDFYHMLAKENHIDPYSYQYEVLESCELEFAHASGLAAAYLNDGHFDAKGFMQHWFEQQRMARLQEIAKQHMGVEDLEGQPALKAALLAAYHAGKEKV